MAEGRIELFHAAPMAPRIGHFEDTGVKLFNPWEPTT
jgi:hypothetical protein